MKLRKKVLFYILQGLFMYVWSIAAQAQDNDTVLDPAGYVTKYNVDFDGIGPRVYVLPAPRTREELLTDSYQEKIYFQDSIDKALDLQQLIDEFKPTANTTFVEQLISPLPTDAEDWNKIIDQEIKNESYAIAYGMLHIYATLCLKSGDIQQTLTLLQTALQHAQKTTNTLDVSTIQFNLSNVYLFQRNIEQAGYFQEAFYQTAVQQRSIVEQGNSLTKIALIQAYDRDYRSAENNIIRKAIPLFNKAKAYDRKIVAWQTLAKIYQLQNKHTEAQWFLIQARDLAESKNFTDELAEIEYMLASSKFVQKNYRVAQQEFINAGKLAEAKGNKLLQLAIVDKLGQIYMTRNDLNKAEDALIDYQNLRKVLFDVNNH